MMFAKRLWSSAFLGAGAVVAAFAASTAPADARDQAWMQRAFSSPTASGSSWGQSFDTGSSRSTLARGNPTLSKDGIAQMSDAISRYRDIVKDGGWETIPQDAVKLGLRPGVTHPSVSLLRARLAATGDLRRNSGYSSTFDYYVQEALKRFQLRHGLEPTGTLENKSRRTRNGTRTLNALNVSAQSRLNQLRANLNRLRRYKARAGDRYVMVNIPAQQVEAVENGRVALRHVAVVGKRDRATPILSSKIHRVKFNPDWTLPPTVVREDLIPKGRKMQRAKQSVLEKYEIDAYYDYGGKKISPSKINWFSPSVYNYVYKQEPGPGNPLGFVKIDFHNAHSVYMHDTPSQRIFGRLDRAASSGCIRIQGIDRLVSWILRDNDDWSHSRVVQMKKSGKTKNVSLRKQVPVHFFYITAWTTPEGLVNFRRDLYGKDRSYGVSKLASAY